MTDDPIRQAADHLRRRAIEAGRELASNEADRVAALVGGLEERLANLGRVVTRLEEAVAARANQTERVVESPEPGRPHPIGRQREPSTPLHEKSDEPAPLPEHWTILSLCEDLGLEVVDRRDVPGGSLWVLGNKAAAESLFKRLAPHDIKFTFAPTGSRATGRRPGWFTKSPR
ncbi:MAG: hypothetical protein AB7V46_15080 [Thermomicrobiales bacterium]